MHTETPYDDDYATCVETHAWLRVMSETLNPETVTARLGVQPSKTQVQGSLPHPNSRHPYKYSGWFLDSAVHVQSRDARRHIDWILNQIQYSEKAIAELKSEGSLVDVCVRWDSAGQGGPTLYPKQMGLLSKLNVELWFDIYFVGRENAA